MSTILRIADTERHTPRRTLIFVQYHRSIATEIQPLGGLIQVRAWRSRIIMVGEVEDKLFVSLTPGAKALVRTAKFISNQRHIYHRRLKTEHCFLRGSGLQLAVNGIWVDSPRTEKITDISIILACSDDKCCKDRKNIC